MLILAIESSCDDTSAAVLQGPNKVLANIISSQFEVHSPFGGIVPELASRAHIEAINPVVNQALSNAGVSIREIDLVAATRGPGLVGSLLVGFTFAKALSMVHKIPCVGVDHLSGHLLSPFLDSTTANAPAFPYTALVVSGGNSSIFTVSDNSTAKLIARTRDDAAGEAFDKVAKLLGLEYPGGPVISKLAKQGNHEAINFPRAWLDKDSLDFSFSGLKTAVANFINRHKQKSHPLPIADICASFQEAVIDVLSTKTIMAAKINNHNTVVIGGGVAANPRLREIMSNACQQENIKLHTPPVHYCTDNAAMIGLAGYYAYKQGNILQLDDDVYPRSLLN